MYETNHTQQELRKKHISNSVNCFFCGRTIKTKYDIISPEELYDGWGLIINDYVYLCATCQHCYEERKEEEDLEKERQQDGYDYYWEESNP